MPTDGPIAGAIVQSQADNRSSVLTAPIAVANAGEEPVAASNNALSTSILAPPAPAPFAAITQPAGTTNSALTANNRSTTVDDPFDLATDEDQRFVDSLLSPEGKTNNTVQQGSADDDRKQPAIPDSATKKHSAALSLASLAAVDNGHAWQPFVPTSDDDAEICNQVCLTWLNVLFVSGKVTTKKDLIEAPLRQKFAVVMDTEDVDAPCRRVVIMKVRKTTWKIIDEFGDEDISNIVATDVDGPIAEWDVCYHHPSLAHFTEAKEMANKRREVQRRANEDLAETPLRKKMRGEAVQGLQKQGRAMKLRASKHGGEIEVGSIVQVPLADVDCTKVDGKVLTLVVVEKVTYKGDAVPKYRLACAKGPLHRLYDRNSINLVPRGCRVTLGLEHVFTQWKGVSKITERQAAASTSMVGGQGRKKCGCRSGCNTNRCACFKAGRLCGSHCHGGLNDNCANCG